jgi:hypothetical protein
MQRGAIERPRHVDPRVHAGRRRFPRNRTDRRMNDEKIQVRVTSSGNLLDVVVLSKRADRIQVVLGEGVHNVRCDLVPTRSGSAYVGSAMGREIVYERSRDDVNADLARIAGLDFRESRR